MENEEATASTPEPDPAGIVTRTPDQPPLTASQAAGLFAAGAAAFRTGTSRPGMAWQPPSVADLQSALPQYEILAFVARGGMGAVYKGIQRSLSRTVAIKVLPPEAAANDLGFADRFMNEARAMGRLSHPNLVAVHDAGKTSEGLLFFVMEYVEGQDVAQMIQTSKRLEPVAAVEIAVAVCEALAFAHQEGIIHRDIKPSNIMLDKHGRVKVADFGLAKLMSADATLLTYSDMAIGTPDFVAPELTHAGMKVDPRADIYALGVTLYQMLTGHLPRGRFQPPSQIVPQAGTRLDRIVDKALQAAPEKRYGTAVEMKTELERLLHSGFRAAASQGSGARRTRTFALKITAAVVLLAGAASAFWYYFPHQSRTDTSSGPSPVPTPAPMENKQTMLKRSPRNSPGGKAEAVWHTRLHPPGKLRAAGTDMNGQPFDLTASEDFDDFVQVFVLDRNSNPARTWVGLRANGKVVWSDGAIEPGCVGMVRSWGEVQLIRQGGQVESGVMPPPKDPVTDFLFGRLSFLPGKPPVMAYADLSGEWHLESPAFEAGLLEKPDVNSLPKVRQVVVDNAGIGVLREDGRLRIWNQREMKLPSALAENVKTVLPMNTSWAVLKEDGFILNFSVMRQTSNGPEVHSEPPGIRQFLDAEGAAVMLASGGYSPVIKHAGGHWSTDPSLHLINATLAALHKQKNESFSAFHSSGKQGILWIEPAK